MVMTKSVTITVSVGMTKYLNVANSAAELARNAQLLYPYIKSNDIDGSATGILGIRKLELIDLYDKLGY